MYGTPQPPIEAALADGRDAVLDIDVQGARAVRERMPEAIGVFVVPPSFRDLERRLRGRGHRDEGFIAARIAAAREEIRDLDRFDYVVVNDDQAEAVENLTAIVRGARCRMERMRDASRAIAASFEE